MNDVRPRTIRLSEVANNRLLTFCEITGLAPAEVIRSALHVYIERTLMQSEETTQRLPRDYPETTFETEPRAQEKLNHKYKTVVKKRNTKEKRSSGKKPVSSSKTSPSKTSTDSVTIPDTLDCPEFRQAWTDFIAHRMEIKKRFTDRSKRMTLKRLSKSTVKEAIEAIEASILNGWQGVDPSWTKNRNNFQESNRIQGPANDPNYYDDPV